MLQLVHINEKGLNADPPAKKIYGLINPSKKRSLVRKYCVTRTIFV